MDRYVVMGYISLVRMSLCMSWQSYVDQNLVGTKKINSAGIFGHDKSTWATSSGFQVSADELEKLFSAFQDASGIRASGLHINGNKYIALRCDDRSVYGKLVTFSHEGRRWCRMCEDQAGCFDWRI